jgi:thiol-disulfide isomerase/thioredoxin
MRFCFVLCVAALLVAAGGLSNRRAPGFSLQDSKGKQHDLYDYRGKIVLIEIMQTSCPHCRAFSKILDQVKAKYGDRVVSLSVVNPPDSPENVARYLAEVKPSTPILFDSGQMAISYFKLTPENPAINLPHLFIIDANGWIVNDYTYGDATKGIFEGKALFPELDRLLAAKKK